MTSVKKLFKSLGPGFITGASDDDPAGIGTYAQTGALFGYAQLWTALFSFPLMTAIQEMCGRIGIIEGKGLAGVIRKYYSKKILYPMVFLLFIANTINIGADLGAMAASLNLVIEIPFVAWLIIMVIFTLSLQIFVPYKTYAKYLKYLTFALLAYILAAFVIPIDWGTVFAQTFIPHFSFSKAYLINIVAIFGTTISPYLFFWQTSEEVEEEVEHKRLRQMGAGLPKVYSYDISKFRLDTVLGMFFSNLVMFFIIITTASALHKNGIFEIQSAAQAAQALRPIAGDFAFLLFALGILGTGLLAVPILAGAVSYAVSETFGWKEGLYKDFMHAKGFYITIIAATIIGFLINFIGIDPIKALYYSAVVNGIIAPPLLIMILVISNNADIMKRRTNSFVSNALGIITVVIMTVAAIGLLYTSFFS